MLAKVSNSGRTTIPKKIRRILNIENGGNLFFMIENDEIKLFGFPGTDADRLAGSLSQYAKNYVDLQTVRKTIDNGISKEIATENDVV